MALMASEVPRTKPLPAPDKPLIVATTAMVISALLPNAYAVDHTLHDTTSVMATMEHRFGLQPIGTRDAAVADLSSVFDAAAVAPPRAALRTTGAVGSVASEPKSDTGTNWGRVALIAGIIVAVFVIAALAIRSRRRPSAS